MREASWNTKRTEGITSDQLTPLCTVMPGLRNHYTPCLTDLVSKNKEMDRDWRVISYEEACGEAMGGLAEGNRMTLFGTASLRRVLGGRHLQKN